MCPSHAVVMVPLSPGPHETHTLHGPDACAALRRLQRELDHFTDMTVELLPRPGELDRTRPLLRFVLLGLLAALVGGIV